MASQPSGQPNRPASPSRQTPAGLEWTTVWGGHAKTRGADAILLSVTVHSQEAGTPLCVATPLTLIARRVECLVRALQPLMESKFCLRTPSKVQPNNHVILATPIEDSVTWTWPNLCPSNVARSPAGSWEAPPAAATTKHQQLCALANQGGLVYTPKSTGMQLTFTSVAPASPPTALCQWQGSRPANRPRPMPARPGPTLALAQSPAIPPTALCQRLRPANRPGPTPAHLGTMPTLAQPPLCPCSSIVAQRQSPEQGRR